MASRNDTYYVLVICDSQNVIVGTGAVIVERKFIHNLGLVGHIEDIAVAKDQLKEQRKGNQLAGDLYRVFAEYAARRIATVGIK